MIKEQTLSKHATISLARYTAAFAPYTLTVLRIFVGITFLLHGLPKLMGMAFIVGLFTNWGIPAPGIFAPLVTALEVLGGLLLIAGLATRWVSLLFIVEMIVTTLVVKLPRVGFIAVPSQPGTGAELDLLLLVVSLVLLAHGSGMLSVEHNLLKREL
jgi:putative oxidoreductase